MDTLLEWLEYVEESEDSRQSGKVRHRLKGILVIVLFATLANADDWVEIGIFAQYHEEFLRKYILKMVEVFRPKLSLRKKRFVIAQDPEKLLEFVMSI